MENSTERTEVATEWDAARVLPMDGAWYHTTEDEGLSEPYETEAEANTALAEYVKALEEPTQLPDSLTDAGEIAI